MPQLLKSPITQVVTKDGECLIHIELTININTEGSVSSVSKQTVIEDKDKVNWAIPEFDSPAYVDFGKRIGE